MKLLFDHNLSHKLCVKLEDLYSDSIPVRMIGLERAGDLEVWEYARENEFVIVTQDADFYDLGLLKNHPPKIIWLRCGNQPTQFIADILRRHYQNIAHFLADPGLACLEIY